MTSTVPFVSNGVANGNGNKLLNPQVSARIRERLIESGVSFLANDNIADHLQPGELDQLQVEVADKVRDLLRSLVIDIDNDHNCLLYTSPSPRDGSISRMPSYD